MNWLETFIQVMSPGNVIMMNVGLFAGIVIGCLPGLNTIFAISVLLPFTFGMDSISGMYLLLGTYCGACYGGSISAILINTPGTPAACATTFDGYPMAKQGRAGDALKAAVVASTVGGLASCLSLMFIAPQLAKVAMSFGAPEFFALAVFGLCATIGIAGDKVIKGIIMMIIGLLISTVGVDATEGTQRFMFGIPYLLAGVKPVTVMLGVFALGEVLLKSRELYNHKQNNVNIIAYQKASVTIRELFKYWKTMLKSSILGVIIGAVPGTGATISAMFSYNVAKQASKNPEEFGTGCLEGIIAPETGNNATTGSTLIPLLTMGIPGDASAAVLLGALTIQGIVPGPELFASQSVWVYLIMGGLLVINLFMYCQGSLLIRLFANIIKVPAVILLPCILILSVVGSFAIANVTFDVGLLLVFALLGYFIKCNDYPVSPLIIALVLGTFMESNLRRSLILSQGSYAIFVTRPICFGILIVAIFSLFYPILKQISAIRNKIS